ncbi:hypothetical protein MYX84_02970 [Acidobacteria bacterium AH-259-O06]|nr:hypothetical protein [Acidobacteria bacterium AH-259-O06]
MKVEIYPLQVLLLTLSGWVNRHQQEVIEYLVEENRVKPLRPYLDWAKTDDVEGLAESVFENLRREPHVYLLPEYEDPASQQEVLEEFWPILFEAMLEGWVRDEAFWPRDRTLGMFQEWFEIQMCSMVQDLDMDEPLELG